MSNTKNSKQKKPKGGEIRHYRRKFKANTGDNKKETIGTMQSTTLVGARWDEAGVRGNKGEIEKSFIMCTLPVAN